MSRRVQVLVVGFGVGAVVGAVLAQQSVGRHRRALFSGRPLRRLSALSYVGKHPSVEAVRLLHDYLTWEQHPMLRRRAERIVRRMEARLAEVRTG
ncbi:MAG: hypothetical protein OEO20_03255 [Gemmatimonadota bacterium]|nr:hypothetical protein [Gemmatimonadota bacterium]MDH3368004.1 hypothetical protein [Gemmatimonadota bacterium]MDH3477301.1 hypothetical protein [Gemmatimonadota bacterium]MDH3569830.1 hypothetical protein [Gemmatimonadota bacterium]MDH5550656.1 hypothetical protein [Gemmatimonadota bacterium]